MIHLGTIPASSTIYIPFSTYSSDDPSASITLTGLAVTDIEIYKNGSTTQRSSDAGFTLLDTDGIDFDGITGIHGFSVDLSDNTDASFYAVGSFYWVVVSAVTVDAATINFVAATFRIGPAENTAGYQPVDVELIDGDATAAGNLNSACDNYSATRGLAGTALPAAAADAAGGLPISDAGGLDLDTKLANTNEVTVARMGALTDWINGGRLDLILDDVLADTAVIGPLGAGLTDLGGMSTTMKAEILAEVNAALNAAISELGVAAPTATPTLRTGMMLLYMALRNKLVVQTSGTDAIEIYNDAGTKIAAKLITDDGSDYTEAEMA